MSESEKLKNAIDGMVTYLFWNPPLECEGMTKQEILEFFMNRKKGDK